MFHINFLEEKKKIHQKALVDCKIPIAGGEIIQCSAVYLRHQKFK